MRTWAQVFELRTERNRSESIPRKHPIFEGNYAWVSLSLLANYEEEKGGSHLNDSIFVFRWFSFKERFMFLTVSGH